MLAGAVARALMGDGQMKGEWTPWREGLRPLLCGLLALPVLTGWSGEARAEDDDESYTNMPLAELLNVEVTTASKTPERIEDAPGSLTVITSQQILDMNAQTLRDVLNVLVPGMDVVPTYFRYGDRVNEGIYSRGLLSDFSQQVTILFNGHSKFNETTWGSPFPAIEFTLENVERIEVSRSPLPLYGGAAFTVINIITKEQSLRNDVQFQGALGLEAGSGIDGGLRAKKFSVLFGQDVAGWYLGGSVQYYQDEGQRHGNPEGQGVGTARYRLGPDTLRDGTKGAANVTFSLISPAEELTIQSWYKYTNRDAYLSGQVVSPSQDQYFYRGTEWLTHAIYRPWASLRLVAGAQTSSWFNFYDLHDGETDTFTPAGGGEKNYDVFFEGNYTLKFDALGSHSLLAGGKLEREGQYEGSVFTWDATVGAFRENQDQMAIFAPNSSRTVASVFLEDAWKPGERLSIAAGVRLDHYRGFGDKKETLLSPRLALRANPVRGLVLKALYASARRPPAIYERQGANAAPLRGNENIRSERVDTFELAAIYRTDTFKLQITPFLGLFKDKIEYLPAEAGQVAQNNGRTRSGGIDAEARLYLDPNNYVFANGTWLQSGDQQNGHATYFLPSIYLNAGLNVRYADWNFNLTGYYRNDRPLPPELTINRRHVHSALRSNAAVSRYFRRSLKAYLLVENIADVKTNIPLSVDGLFVPMRGRTLVLGLVFGVQPLE
jgi:outer membrane receptor for ferrienterochelin and colicins